MKRFISFFMAMVLAFTGLSCAVTAADVDPAPEVTDVVLPTGDEDTKTWEDCDEVVEMYLCAVTNVVPGHVWLYFKNLTEYNVPIGYINIEPGQEISVGSLAHSRKYGDGTYYNGEGIMATNNADGVCEHTFTLKMKLTPEQLKTVNKKICSMDNYDMIFNNCGVFATIVWNSVSDKKVVHIVFPFLTIINMLMYGAKKGELNMRPAAESKKAYKQRKGYCDDISHDLDFLLNKSIVG